MKFFLICFRNISRNKRRSMMTIMAISLGTLAILTFGGYFFSTMFGMESSYIRRLGHIQIYKKGFFEYGVGNPAEYSIYNFQDVISTIKNDVFFKDKLNVVTPILQFSGIVGNFKEGVSKTFFGRGVIPSDMKTMNSYRGRYIRFEKSEGIGLNDDNIRGGVIGFGMARILHLCNDLHLQECQDEVKKKPKAIDAPREDFSNIIALDKGDQAGPNKDNGPQLDLLATQVGGAPNVVQISVTKAQHMAIKELDDNYITVNLQLAQQLVYGKAHPGITGIILQLKSMDDLAVPCARLNSIFKQKGYDLEIKRFEELAPYYGQVKSFIGSIFIFMSIIMGVVVLFTVVNTMSMSVMERVNEIGTIRTLGLRRSDVIRQFVIEGGLLGFIGGTIGVMLALLVEYVINISNIVYIPPGNIHPVPLAIQILSHPGFAPLIWIGFIIISMLSSYIPARKAGRMKIVDALGHY